MAMRFSLVALVFVGATALAAACSGSKDEGSDGGSGGMDGGGLLFLTGGSANAETDACAPTANAMGCVGERYQGETIPLDIYVMFDQSGSMANPESGGPTRMEAVRNAVGDFLKNPESTGLSVGIGYFGFEPLGETTCDPD